MKIIKLNSRKYLGYETIVDYKDYELLLKYKWYPYVNVKSNTVYAISKIDNKTTQMHRFILMNHNENIENKFIDHWDHNGLNNKKKNLRICSQSQNQQNNEKPKHGKTSKYKGVHKRKNNTFYAQITLNNKQIHIGSYDTEEKAALAYNKKAIELFGKFANLNVIKV